MKTLPSRGDAQSKTAEFEALKQRIHSKLVDKLDLTRVSELEGDVLRRESDPAGAGFQVKQSLIALGSGGIAGVGFGQGRQKFGFLPEAHNDFIFAMIGEEWGILGVTAVISLYMAVVLVGFRVASRCQDLFGQLLAIGLTSWIALQAVLHMSVGVAMVPTTGLALPLISYGRSNLLVTLAAFGILMSVARGVELPPAPRGRRARA